MSTAQDLRAVWDWLAEWPSTVGQSTARDTMMWPWSLYEKRMSEVLVLAWVNSYEQGQAAARRDLTKRQFQYGDLQYANPRTVMIAREETAHLITEVSRDTRRAVAAIMSTGFREGQDWRQIAQRVRQTVGIHSRNAAAVDRRFMDRLDEYQRGGMSPAAARDKAGRLAERERARAVRSRSVTIARTETTRANTLSRREAWGDANRDGLIPKGSRVEWLAADPCPDCAYLDGTSVPWDQSFQPSDPPLHPRCRCTLILVTPKTTQPGSTPSSPAKPGVGDWGSMPPRTPTDPRAYVPDDIAPIGQRVADHVESHALMSNTDPHSLALMIRSGRMKSCHETMSSIYRDFPSEIKFYRGARLSYEDHYMGLGGTAARQRPIYGYVEGSGGSLGDYGSVKITFRESVRDRATVTAGDSLNGMARPIPVSRVQQADPMDWFQAGVRIRPNERHPAYHKPIKDWAGYIETQIQGGVDLSDIENIDLGGGHMFLNDQQLRKLAKAGVKVNGKPAMQARR